MIIQFSEEEYDEKSDKLVTIQDKFPVRLICKDLKGSSFPNIFLVEEFGREKIILANSSGITGSRDRKYDIGIVKGV